jgi:uncharacterized membrane protein
MSRGAKCLAAGLVLVVVSYIGGVLIQQAAVESFQQSRGPREAFDTVNRLSPWAGVVNLAFYAGILSMIVGIVLLIIDSSRQPAPPPAGSSVSEEENRRLREELERTRRERGE